MSRSQVRGGTLRPVVVDRALLNEALHAVALIGHYLRVTSNPTVGVEVGRLMGGGILASTGT
jgi:hypothetical protein